MTPDERKAQMNERNAAICAYYEQGHKLAECASRFKLGRQRVLQILQAAGVWHPYVKSDRTLHLGVTVSPEAKRDIEAAAGMKGVSVSQFAADALEAAAKEGR